MESTDICTPVALIAGMLAVGIFYLRFPLNESSIAGDLDWKTSVELARRDSGELANKAVASDRRVLWTGFGYPAYLFDGYVVDFSGLNFPKIWEAMASVTHPTKETNDFLTSIGVDATPSQDKDVLFDRVKYYLISLYQPTVFMQHTIFNEALQKTLGLRLAGSFYAVDLFGFPAFRVFVKDPAHSEINHVIALQDIEITGDTKSEDQISITGRDFKLALPDHTSRLSFGVYQKPQAFEVLITDFISGRELARCSSPALREPQSRSIHSCELQIVPSDSGHPFSIIIKASDGDIRVFEPVATEYLGATQNISAEDHASQ